MKIVAVEDSVGTVLCHDITQIVPGEFKGVAFRKGHVIQAEDIPRLLKIGKEHIYIWDLQQDRLHENDAAQVIAKSATGSGVMLSEAREGKVDFIAARPGLLKVDYNALYAINEIEQIVFSSLNTNQVVQAGKTVAAAKIVPLVIDKGKIDQVVQICEDNYPIVEVKNLLTLQVGVVVTGSEVATGRIKDAFVPVISEKLSEFGSSIVKKAFVTDNSDLIASTINSFVDQGCEMVIVTGGMSVDPDDVTPTGVIQAGGQLVTYGAPALPGAMFMLAYLEDIPVVGLPGCAMYNKRTIFDLVLPRLLAGEKLTRGDIIRLGHGGLCQSCSECQFPNCGFGRG